jgi:hypothetical protein
MHHQPEWVESELCHSHQELLELRWEVVSEGGDVEITDHQDQDHGKASGTSRGWEIPMGLFEESLSSLQKTRARNWEQGGRLPLIFPLWETLAAMFQADRRGTHTSFPLSLSPVHHDIMSASSSSITLHEPGSSHPSLADGPGGFDRTWFMGRWGVAWSTLPMWKASPPSKLI